MRYLASSIILIVCAAIIGCSSSSTSVKISLPLENTKWMLSSLNGKDVNSDKVYIQFNKEAAKLGGQSFCNDYFASYSVTDAGSLTVSDLGSTKMECDEMSGEIDYFSAVKSAKSYKISGNSLSLLDGSKVIVKFKALK
jgi:heat shock protein HslJ